MGYGRVRFEAVVDWIEIEICTAQSTNFQTVQGALRGILRLSEGKNPYVKPIDEGAGDSAWVLRLRIYDPQS